MSITAPRGLLVGNQWRTCTETLPVIDPFTGNEIARAPLGDEALLEEAIGVAQAAFKKTRAIPAHARAGLLEKVAIGIEKRSAELAETIMSESGKPIIFAEAEVGRAVMTFTTAAGEARQSQGALLPLDGLPPGAGHFGMVRRFPIGVIGAITPFNFPLNLVAHKVAPCLATGNTMVLKPAMKTPLTALLLAEILVEAGMPEGQINFVTCTNEVAAQLVQDERVKKITFTGSPEVGWRLKQQCGKKRITLELGGNAGVILHSDADLGMAIPAIAMGGFGQAGQSCISVQRIVIHESRYEEFRERFLAHILAKIKTGDPRDRETIVGPMINAEALDRVRQQISDAVAAGATVALGGIITGRCLEATVLENLDPRCDLVAGEAFAPVVTLHRYREFEEALEFINASVFGLQAGVYTRDLNLAMQAFEALDVGGVLINQVPTWRVDNMPYGGVKESGFGREGVRYAMEEMTELKSLVMKLD
ncbi:MAG: Lactaldehyde dehydrogenase [Chthoniobacteraceae bacterium]|nr:Lactaldehyde dehydrogenase [Chthoniobacteraceae bacterium]